MSIFTTVDAYLNQFDGEVRTRLDALRDVVRSEAPDAEEGLMYGLVGYKFNKKPLVYFGGFPYHIGFYATPEGHAGFAKELSKYKQGKGSVQFPLDQPLPIELVQKMVQFKKHQLGG